MAVRVRPIEEQLKRWNFPLYPVNRRVEVKQRNTSDGIPVIEGKLAVLVIEGKLAALVIDGNLRCLVIEGNLRCLVIEGNLRCLVIDQLW